MTERSPKSRYENDERNDVPVARSSSTDVAPASVAVPILERRRRATVAGQPVLVQQRAQEQGQVERSWDRARWVNEVRRFDTAWDVDAPRSSRPAPAVPFNEQVTLVVYEWQNAEPGTLSWQFSDSRAAVTAARAMRNAVRWAVVSGTEHDLGRARAAGAVLAEADDDK